MDGKEDEKREMQIQRQINNGHTESKRLVEIIDKVEDRLSSILLSPEPKPPDSDKPETTLVPLANELRTINETIMQQIGRLMKILERLEL